MRPAKYVEQFPLLVWRTVGLVLRQDRALPGGERVNLQRRGRRGGAEAETAKGMAIQSGLLIDRSVVAIAVGVLLVDREFQSRPAGKARDRFRALEDGALFLVAHDRQRGSGPTAFLGVAIDGVR